MNLTSDMLIQIEEYGKILMLPNDIAEIMEFDKREFISELNDTESVIKKAYYKGTLMTEVTIRQKATGIFDGNSLAEDIAFSLKDLREFKSRLIIQLHG